MAEIERPRWATGVAVFASAFGLISVIAGTVVLFVGGTGREAAGDYVAFVLWFNFLAGFAYIGAAAGLLLWRPWVVPLAFAIAALTVAVFIAFGVHVLMGGAYEARTIYAMAFRSLAWVVIAFALRGKIL